MEDMEQTNFFFCLCIATLVKFLKILRISETFTPSLIFILINQTAW